MATVEYESSCLYFKADVIENLKRNDSFIVRTPDGTFKMTKADFYEVFKNVTESNSYKEKRFYSMSHVPKKALQFLVDPKSEDGLVSAEIRQKIKEIAVLWKKSKSNPKTSEDVIKAWNKVILEWVEDESLPLVVRRSKDKRGHVYTHSTGRKIIVSDNTAATWVMYNVLNGKTLTLDNIKDILKRKELPIAFAFKKEEIDGATYTKTQGKYALPYWNVCHIDPVGLKTRGEIKDMDIESLKNHFKKFLSPGNMFIVPKSIAGLGEVQDFIDIQQDT